jgi:hypothetical protein
MKMKNIKEEITQNMENLRKNTKTEKQNSGRQLQQTRTSTRQKDQT